MSENIKKIRVTISYSVGLGELNVDKKTYSELKELFENGVNITLGDVAEMQFPNASEWLRENIKERDCYNWECEIDEFK